MFIISIGTCLCISGLPRIHSKNNGHTCRYLYHLKWYALSSPELICLAPTCSQMQMALATCPLFRLTSPTSTCLLSRSAQSCPSVRQRHRLTTSPLLYYTVSLNYNFSSSLKTQEDIVSSACLVFYYGTSDGLFFPKDAVSV
jgi:hypothetical protein